MASLDVKVVFVSFINPILYYIPIRVLNTLRAIFAYKMEVRQPIKST